MIFAAIMAGGSGTRMGTEVPKQFLDLCGTPILIRTVKKFLDSHRFDGVFIGISKNWVEYTEQLLSKYGINEKVILVCGGSERYLTLHNVVEYIYANYSIGEKDILVTHDAVRPLLSDEMIAKSIDCTFEHGVSCVMAPVWDTMVLLDENKSIDEYCDRNKLRIIQTPQSFNLKLYKQATEKLKPEGMFGITDATSIFVSAGMPVYEIMGTSTNLKITTKDDLKLAEKLLK